MFSSLAKAYFALNLFYWWLQSLKHLFFLLIKMLSSWIEPVAILLLDGYKAWNIYSYFLIKKMLSWIGYDCTYLHNIFLMYLNRTCPGLSSETQMSIFLRSPFFLLWNGGGFFLLAKAYLHSIFFFFEPVLGYLFSAERIKIFFLFFLEMWDSLSLSDFLASMASSFLRCGNKAWNFFSLKKCFLFFGTNFLHPMTKTPLSSSRRLLGTKL